MLSGRFKPGERLIERELCDMMGVSRTAVREALRQLESEGLVENIAKRGPIVARITRTDAISIYEMRGVIRGPRGPALHVACPVINNCANYVPSSID